MIELLGQTLYRPPLSLFVVLPAVALVLSLLVLAAWKERAWWTMPLRVAALAGLAWLLFGPSVPQPAKPSASQKPRLAILVDTSASMGEEDAVSLDGQAISRLQAVAESWLDPARLSELRAHADLELIAFSDQVQAASLQALEPTGRATRLYAALDQVQADATLILSDGHDTAAQSTSRRSHHAGRLYASPVGAPRSAPDLALDAWPESDRLFAGQTTSITASIRQHGLVGQNAQVELLSEGQVIARELIQLQAQATTLRFEIEPTLPPGITTQAHHYTARVALASGDEAYLDNNQQDLFVQVSQDQVRVLLLEGEPYWDTRALARVVGAHPRFDLTAIYGFGDQRRSRVLGAFMQPGNEPTDQLAGFDIVVLGRRVDRLVDANFGERLASYVRDGGAVVFARGPAFDGNTPEGDRLAQATQSITPGRWGETVFGEMRLRLNESGNRTNALEQLGDQAIISRLPGMLAATRLEDRKAASIVLLEQQAGEDATSPMAGLTTMRVGAGMTMAVLTEGLWRWELLPGVGEDREAESAYAVFWVRALQWLASGGEFLPGQDIAIEADRLSLEPDEAVTLTVSTRYVEADTPDLRLSAIAPDGTATPINLQPGSLPNRFNAMHTPSDLGVVRYVLEAPGRPDLIDPDHPLATRVVVVDRSPERRDTAAQPDRLVEITEATGGRCLAFDGPEPLIEYLQTLQMARGTEEAIAYDFNRLPTFFWIVGCFGLEWILRRRSGLR